MVDSRPPQILQERFIDFETEQTSLPVQTTTERERERERSTAREGEREIESERASERDKKERGRGRGGNMLFDKPPKTDLKVRHRRVMDALAAFFFFMRVWSVCVPEYCCMYSSSMSG